MIEKVKFNLYSILFTPYTASNSLNSKDIIENVLKYVTPVNLGNKVHIIDRNRHRENTNPRELFIDYVVYDHREKRYKSRIVLIRSGRPPMLKPHDSHKLVSMREVNNLGSLVEVTNFYVDMNKPKPYLFVEYNDKGPRALDIEYYFRNVVRDQLRQAKETKIQIYIDVSLEKILDEMKEVQSFNMTIEPHHLDGIETNFKNKYFSGLSSFGRLLNTRYLQVKASFEVIDKKGVAYDNREAKSMLDRLFRSIKNKSSSLDSFKNLAINFTDKNGESRDINILNHQRGFVVEIDFQSISKLREVYTIVKPEIDCIMNDL